MQSPPAVALVYLDLASGGRPGFAGRALELFPELREDRALIFAGGLELLHLGFEPRLSLVDRLTLPLCELGESRRQTLLDPIEVAGPFRQSLLDAALDECEGLADLTCKPPFLLSQLGAPGFGKLSFVLGKTRARLGARAHERALELLAALNRLAFDELSQRGLGLLELRVDSPAPCQPGLKRQGQQGCCAAHGQPSCGHGCSTIDVEREDDPADRRGEPEQNGYCRERPTGAPSRQSRRNRGRDENDPGGERDLHGGLGAHNAGS